MPTPKTESGSLPPAGYLRRMAAWIIDSMLVNSVAVCVVFFVVAAHPFGSQTAQALFAFLFGGVLWRVPLESSLGTPGRRLLGIRVCLPDGARPAPSIIGFRQMAWLMFGTVCPLLCPMSCMFISRRRGLHELFSGTVSTHTRPGGKFTLDARWVLEALITLAFAGLACALAATFFGSLIDGVLVVATAPF